METIAIYPGSFNPFTVGHQNILEKAEAIFGKDNVIVAIGISNKKLPNATTEEKKEFVELKAKVVKQQIPSKTVEGYVGFLTKYARKKQEETGKKVVIVRGLRNGHDFEYEANLSRAIWDQMPGLPIIELLADPIYMHVSSSLYRECEAEEPGSGHKYLAKEENE